MTAWLRLTLYGKSRAEVYEIRGPDVLIGAAEHADFRLTSSGVEEEHARIIVRRGRAIVVDLGARRGIARDGDRLLAPSVMGRDRFIISEYGLSAEVVGREQLGWVGSDFGEGTLSVEWRSVESAQRAYAIVEEDGFSLVRAATSADESDAWHRTLSRPAALDGRHFASKMRVAVRQGRVLVTERFPAGVILESLLEASARGAVTWPLPVTFALMGQLGEALVAYHRGRDAHGWVLPSSVFIGEDGGVRLLMPGPGVPKSSAAITFANRTARMGLPATISGDAYALGAIGSAVSSPEALPEALKAFLFRLQRPDAVWTRAAFAEAVEQLRALGPALGLDPSTAHLGRLARLPHPTWQPWANVNSARRVQPLKVG